MFAPSLGVAGAAGGISGDYHCLSPRLRWLLVRVALAPRCSPASPPFAGGIRIGAAVARLVGHSYIEKGPHQLET